MEQVVSRDFARAQVRRFGNTVGFRDLPDEAIVDLIDEVALCPDEAGAERLVTEWVRGSKFCPTLYDLRAMRASLFPGARGTVASSTGCANCGGNGYRIVEVLLRSNRFERDLAPGEAAAIVERMRAGETGLSVSTRAVDCDCLRRAPAA